MCDFTSIYELLMGFSRFLAAILKGPNGYLKRICQGGSTSEKFPEDLKKVFRLLFQLYIDVQDCLKNRSYAPSL